MQKRWYSSRTIQLAIAKILAGSSTALATGSWEPLIVAGLGVLDWVMRVVTHSSIGKAPEPPPMP